MQLKTHSSYKPTRPRANQGFSLIELLVVIGIILILITLIVPTMKGIQERAQRIRCAENERNLWYGWTQWAMDHDGKLLSSNNNGISKYNGAPPWALNASGSIGDRIARLRQSEIFQYLTSTEVYRCPTHVERSFQVRSYSVPATMNGEQAQRDTKWFGAYNMSHILLPAKQLVFIEEHDWRGYLMNSFMCVPHEEKFVDFVAANHQGGDNLIFADGHVELWKWEDPDTIAFSFGDDRHFYRADPGNVDLKRLEVVFDSTRYALDNGY